MFRCLLTLLFLLLTPLSLSADDKYALLVGVTKYQKVQMNRLTLDYPEEDAKAVGKVLGDSGYTVKLLLGSEATGAVIEAALKEFETQGTTDGVVFIGLFGHGVQYGQDAYFCPYDTTIREVRDSAGKELRDNGNVLLEPNPVSLVSMRRLLDALRKTGASNRVLFADCCREDPAAARGLQLARRAFGSEVKISDLEEGTAALFSCRDQESAFEHKDWGHGAFTKAFLDYCAGLSSDADTTISSMSTPLYRGVNSLVKAKDPSKTQRVNPIINGIVDLQLRPAGRPQVVTNSVGMKLVLIPAGEFLMGSPEGEEGREDDEGPQHRVRISRPFYLGETEVTQEQFRAVMNTEPWKGETQVQENGRNAASFINHDDAVEFCRRLSQREGKTYRLPREAEWEYACRGGTTTRFHFGDDESRLGEYAWFRGNAYDKDEKYAHAVRQKKPNPFGLYDMHGNVFEWCEDWFASDYYVNSTATDPTGPDSGPSRVLRSGSWGFEPFLVRCARRFNIPSDSRYDCFGIRVLLE